MALFSLKSHQATKCKGPQLKKRWLILSASALEQKKWNDGKVPKRFFMCAILSVTLRTSSGKVHFEPCLWVDSGFCFGGHEKSFWGDLFSGFDVDKL